MSHMNAQIYRVDGTARKYVSVQRPAGAPRARTEAHFWGMVRDNLNENYAGEHRYCWDLWRPHKTPGHLTGMPFALSRGPNRDEMIIDSDYAIRDVRALYNAGTEVRLSVVVS